MFILTRLHVFQWWFLLWNFVTSEDFPVDEGRNNTLTKDGCFGKQTILSCGYNSTILISSITYERNCTSCKCGVNPTDVCEEFSLPGSWENYLYYDVFSGKGQGEVIVNRTECIGSPTVFVNRMMFNYYCIDDDRITDWCNGHIVQSDQGVYVKYKYKDNLPFPGKDCRCKVNTSSVFLQVHAIDIRLQKYGDNSGTCNKRRNSFIKLTDGTFQKFIGCEENKILGNYGTIYNSSDSTLNMHLHLEEDPQMVWIAVTAHPGGHVSITCTNEVIRDSFTSDNRQRYAVRLSE